MLAGYTGLYALLIDADKFAWMIPFAVLGLPSILAIYTGLYCYLWKRLSDKCSLTPLPSILLFAVISLLSDFARGHLFTGFPWNLPATTWTGSLPMLQSAHFLGVYGLSFWTVLLAALPAAHILTRKNLPLLLSLLMIILPFGYGYARLENHPTEYTNITLKLIQPSIPQDLKWKPEERVHHVQQHVELSRPKAGEKQADLLIWSESAYPYVMEDQSPPIQYITREVVPQGSYLLTGAVRFDAKQNIYHGLSVVKPDGTIAAQYDKVKLVPFGEFMPFRSILPIQKITHGMQDFSAGKHGQTVSLPQTPEFLPLICYEVIFPEMSEAPKDRHPQWLLNLTNDGWYGESTGPYQHFYIAKMRAVEQGLPMVRAANNGISAVIDAYGRTVAELPLNAVGALEARLPKPSAY